LENGTSLDLSAVLNVGVGFSFQLIIIENYYLKSNDLSDTIISQQLGAGTLNKKKHR